MLQQFSCACFWAKAHTFELLYAHIKNYRPYCLLRTLGVQAGNNFQSGGQTGHQVQGGSNKVLQIQKITFPPNEVIFHFVWVTAGNVSSIGRLHYTFYVLFYFILFAVDIIIFDPNNLLSFQWLLAQSVRALESFKADVGCSSPSRSKTDNRLQNIQMVDYCRVNIGKNLLVNRLTILNNQINYEWLNLSYDAFKLRCKNILLIFWLRLFDL